MKKEETFKCIKDTPTGSYKAGSITDNPLCAEFPEHFEKYKFTTHDGHDLYGTDKCYAVDEAGKFIDNESFTGDSDDLKYFRFLEAARAHIKKNKPKFEVGKVYKHATKMSIYALTEILDSGLNRFICYGLNDDGYWSNSMARDLDFPGQRFIEATPAEWEAALIKEAERRYPVGTTIASNFYGNLEGIQSVRNNNFRKRGDDDVIYVLGSADDGCALNIYHQGKWATIIEKPTAAEWYPEAEVKQKTTAEWIRSYKESDMVLSEFVKKNDLIITKSPSHA